jgi:hypothetical protein
VTARDDDDMSNAELPRRLKRVEAELRQLLTGIPAGGAPDGSSADAWIGHMRRQAEDAGQLRRVLGDEPPVHRPRGGVP